MNYHATCEERPSLIVFEQSLSQEWDGQTDRKQ